MPPLNFIRRLFSKSEPVGEDERFLEDVNTSVERMRRELDLVTRAAAEAMQHHHRLEESSNKYQRQVREWESRARSAVADGDETLARKALQKKNEALMQVEASRATVNESAEQTRTLSQQVAELKAQIAEAERQARTLVARRNAARAQKRMADAMAGLGTEDHAFSAIAEYENTVQSEEAKARVLDELTLSSDTDDSSPVDSIEQELAKLKLEVRKDG